MDNLVTIYHRGTVEFVDIQSVPVLFNDRPSFSEMVAKARETLHCLGDDGIAVEGVLHLGSPPNILRRNDPNWLCGSVGELCEIGYKEPTAMFGHGCASGVS